MDPCPFMQILVGNLALKSSPVSPKHTQSSSTIHPSSSPYFCKIKLPSFPHQISPIPLSTPDFNSNSNSNSQLQIQSLAACFNITKSHLSKLFKSSLFSKSSKLKLEIFTGSRGQTCGFKSAKLLGTVEVDLKKLEFGVLKNGWVSVGDKTELHLTVRIEPDPRFVFEFDGEPECSPQIFQIDGSIRQPVFTCKFRNCGSNSVFGSFKVKNERDQYVKERKGWSVTIHDLSGSPVAAASMVTPFVPSPGSDRVSRSNPGAWLIRRPGNSTWKPWGRLEAWRERGIVDGIGYRFELLTEDSTSASCGGITVANSVLSAKNGGKFEIDAPRVDTNGEFGSGYGFVMSASVEGMGKCSKPVVEVGLQHVTCTEDAAAFVALAAAMDLSMDACMLFSRKLRRELRQPSQDFVVSL
ncbi:Protein of unknown function DUF1005 [Dillenia turbinata]|uniref:Uncharacterized protein n=1 Tax=Dillenia turbinata TaxID=194707 RepID=A0AAN8WC53_9MAGN